MNITDSQLKEIALAGGMEDVNNLSVRKSENYFELGKEDEKGNWETFFSLKFIVGPCSDGVNFNANTKEFDKDLARRRMENLGLIERL